MVLPPKIADRLSAFLVYMGVGALALWAGSALIEHALYSKFYKDYLLEWRAVFAKYNREQGGIVPPFSGGDQAAYMDRLGRWLAGQGVSLPTSNTDRPYIYRLRRLWSPNEDIFLFWYENALVLYGLSRKTFDRLDRDIDGVLNEAQGEFTGKQAPKGRDYIARWRW